MPFGSWRNSLAAAAAFAALGNVAAAPTMLQMPTGGVTGTYYMIGSPLAQYINDHSANIRVTPNTSGGGYENIRRVDAALAQIGMTQPDTMYQAWNGLKPFDKPLRNWRVVGIVTPPMANHVVVLKNDQVKTVSDLKGKIFAIGAPGSGSTVSMMEFLEHTGLKKDIDVRMLPHQDYPEMLLDGKIAAFSRLGAVPASVVDEVGAQKKVDLVDFGAELDRSGFLQKYPYYQKVRVKAGTYKGIDREVTMFGNAGYIIANKDVPDDVVYEFTKLAYSEGAIKVVDLAFKGANLDRKAPFEGNIGPVHPGAARFWKEIGVAVPEPILK
jgi:TRAP transporter TAXI family solute receptor